MALVTCFFFLMYCLAWWVETEDKKTAEEL